MASAKLPPVSALPPVTARGERPGSAGGMQAYKDAAITGPPHPFDGPYSIMKGLQVELGNLQAKFEAEQQLRVAENQALRDEVRLLREALAKERAERVSATTTLNDKLAAEIARHDKSLQILHDQTSFALSERAMVTDFNNLCARFEDLHQECEKEVADRKDAIHNLDARIEINSKGDSEFAQQMVKEQSALRQLLEMNTSNDKVFAGWVEPRILMAGKLLQAGCTAPALPPKVKLSDRAKVGPQSPDATPPQTPLTTLGRQSPPTAGGAPAM